MANGALAVDEENKDHKDAENGEDRGLGVDGDVVEGGIVGRALRYLG